MGTRSQPTPSATRTRSSTGGTGPRRCDCVLLSAAIVTPAQVWAQEMGGMRDLLATWANLPLDQVMWYLVSLTSRS